MIVITEIDLGETEILLKYILIILSQYADLVYVFSEKAANTLLKHGNHDICLETIGTPPFGLLYNLFQNELKVL